MVFNWFRTRQAAPLWLILRFYVGFQWLTAGWEKIAGEEPFSAAKFVEGAIAKATGAHPPVQPWYATFLKGLVLPNIGVFNFLVAYGEFLVGLALIIGFAALMGAFMNLNFMLADSTSTNPVLFTLEVLMLAGGTCVGYLGVDYWFRPVVQSLWERWRGSAKKDRRVAIGTGD